MIIDILKMYLPLDPVYGRLDASVLYCRLQYHYDENVEERWAPSDSKVSLALKDRIWEFPVQWVGKGDGEHTSPINWIIQVLSLFVLEPESNKILRDHYDSIRDSLEVLREKNSAPEQTQNIGALLYKAGLAKCQIVVGILFKT